MPAVDDIYSVIAEGQCIGQRIMLTHHYRLSNFPAGSTDIQVRDRLVDFMRGDAGGDDTWETPYLNAMPQNYTLTGWRVQKVRGTRGAYRHYDRAGTGLIEIDARTANNAAVITLSTDFGGRNQIANKHIGPMPDNVGYYVDGAITPLLKALYQTLGNGLLSHPVDLVAPWLFIPVILHKTGPTLSNEVKLATVQDTVRVMRRRTVGVGI